MRRRLRRFAAVGVLATAIDAGVLLALAAAGLTPAVADVVAVAVASVASYLIHRAVTFADDPHFRWVGSTRLFVLTATAAGALDVAVLAMLLAGRSGGLAVVAAAKAVSLLLAGALRLAAYRRWLFRQVRSVQARREGRPPAPGELRLTVVVPAFRAGDQIGATIGRLRSALAPLAPSGGSEIVVVDDGSGDGTAAAARRAGADQVVVLERNRGKGAAVREGVLAARGRTVAFIDDDLSYSPEQIVRLVEAVESGWDVVVGSRKHDDAVTLVRAGRLRELSGRLFNLLTEVVLLGQYRDTQCGLKAFRSDVARLLFSRTRIERFAFDVELFHLAERYRLSLTEVPVTLASASTSTVRLGLESIRMIRDLFRIRRWAGRGLYDLQPGEHDVPARSG